MPGTASCQHTPCHRYQNSPGQCHEVDAASPGHSAGTGMARGPEMCPTATICERQLVFESRFMEIPALLKLEGKVS